jgi:hypothetical protein
MGPGPRLGSPAGKRFARVAVCGQNAEKWNRRRYTAERAVTRKEAAKQWGLN